MQTELQAENNHPSKSGWKGEGLKTAVLQKGFDDFLKDMRGYVENFTAEVILGSQVRHLWAIILF